ncbi:MAG: 4Fe-4S dicluster domain-containing protein, partial [Phycisphaerae bacterium]
ITLGGRSLTIPVFPLPGHVPRSITLPLGYGRTYGGRVADGAGFDAYGLRTQQAWYIATGATIKTVSGSYKLATTQDHHAIASAVGVQEARKRVDALVREGTLDEYKQDPKFVPHRTRSLPLIQPFGKHEFSDKPRWAMAIDLARCTGCSACVVACQAENNVPVVGKDEVLMGREMHWIRVDRYFTGSPENADIQVVHQPVACQHCENAPCEQVCPVAATVHDEEGLNVMVYNRCIGTRYCSNNCPYKVRRFNWFYNHHGPAHPRSSGKLSRTDLTPIEKMAFNPEVTVRSRGVMEKCTFCLQRINAVKMQAKNEGRPIEDGDIVPACAQACPAEAIVFGDLNDEKSRVRQAHEHDRAYAMLEFLNVRPRNMYLANLRNPAHNEGDTRRRRHNDRSTTEHTG